MKNKPTKILLFFMLLFQFAISQNNVPNINLPRLNYDLVGKKLEFETQEKYLSVISAIGDKSIILEAIINQLLTPKTKTSVDTLFDYWINDFTKSDSVIVSQYPQVTADWREVAFHSIRVCYIVQSYIDSVSLPETYLNIHNDKQKFFPHIPEEKSNYEGELFLLEKYYLYTKWLIKYPEEYNYFFELMKSQAEYFSGNSSNENIVEVQEKIKQIAINTNDVREQNIPLDINTLEYIRSNKFGKELKFIDDCQPNEIEKFIENAYYLVYKEDINIETANKLSSYIKENNIYEAELIYLAIILSKYE